MRSALLALTLFAGMAPALAQEAPECIPSMHVDDAAGDVDVTTLNLASYDAPKLDIRRYEIEQTNDSLILRLTLAERPGGETNEYYRYWLGFYFRTPNGSSELMDVRVAHTATYDDGELVGPNSLGNPTLATLPAEWEGATMTYRIPTSILEDALGKGVTFGAPRSSSDGIHRLLDAQGPSFAAPYLQDSAHNDDVFDKDFPVLRPCLSESPETIPTLGASDPTQETPWPTWALVATLASAALIRRRR